MFTNADWARAMVSCLALFQSASLVPAGLLAATKYYGAKSKSWRAAFSPSANCSGVAFGSVATFQAT